MWYHRKNQINCKVLPEACRFTGWKIPLSVFFKKRPSSIGHGIHITSHNGDSNLTSDYLTKLMRDCVKPSIVCLKALSRMSRKISPDIARTENRYRDTSRARYCTHTQARIKGVGGPWAEIWGGPSHRCTLRSEVGGLEILIFCMCKLGKIMVFWMGIQKNSNFGLKYRIFLGLQPNFEGGSKMPSSFRTDLMRRTLQVHLWSLLRREASPESARSARAKSAGGSGGALKRPQPRRRRKFCDIGRKICYKIWLKNSKWDLPPIATVH